MCQYSLIIIQQFQYNQQLTSMKIGSESSIPFIEGNPLKYFNVPKDDYDRDIIPGVYEGGFKVWECTLDMIHFMSTSQIDFAGKTVLDLGCGHGLLGIAALKKGARKCVFQDYNPDVLQKITLLNIKLNSIPDESCEYIGGDWGKIADEYQGEKLDLIIGSEVIYREQNYEKIVYFCQRMLKETGKAILANKHYYFGVGGNMIDFKEYIENSKMQCESLLKIVPEKGGNKKQIVELSIKK